MTEEIKQHPKTLTPALSRWEREFDVVLFSSVIYNESKAL
jgi:hypothetical protein